jgi:hypothetical protein
MLVKHLAGTSTLHLATVTAPNVLQSKRPIVNESAGMQLLPEARPVVWAIRVTEVAISRETTYMSH